MCMKVVARDTDLFLLKVAMRFKLNVKLDCQETTTHLGQTKAQHWARHKAT